MQQYRFAFGRTRKGKRYMNWIDENLTGRTYHYLTAAVRRELGAIDRTDTAIVAALEKCDIYRTDSISTS